MNRRGYTLIELLVVMTIIGILANIAIPALHDSKKRAEAAAVIGDVHAIRFALFEYYASAGDFPRSARWGTVPPQLAGSLPGGFTFSDGTVTYRWRRFGRRRAQRTGQIGVIQLRSGDRELIRRTKDLYDGAVTGNRRRLSMIIQ